MTAGVLERQRTKPEIARVDSANQPDLLICHDLDDTHLDTYRFWEEAFQAISGDARWSHAIEDLVVEGSKKRLREFYVTPDGSPKSIYSFVKHLGDLGIASDEDVIRQMIEAELKSRDLMYEGTRDFLKNSISIGRTAMVSYGFASEQHMKMNSQWSLCDPRIERHFMTEPKADYLAKLRQDNPNTRMIMFDDANMGAELKGLDIDFVWTTWSDTAILRSDRKGLARWSHIAETPYEATKMLEKWRDGAKYRAV